MDSWENDSCPCIGQHARLSYQDLEKDPPTRPLDFPAPIVHRGAMITVDSYDPKRGEYLRMKNLLTRCTKRGSGGSQDYININRMNIRSENASESEGNVVGYCLRRKLASTVYGGVYKGIVMKKRKLLSGETVLMRDTKQKKHSRGSLKSIVEDDELEDRFEESSPRLSTRSAASDIWEATDEHVIIKASSWTKIRRLRGKHLEDPIKEIQAMQLIGNYHSHFVSYIDAMQDDHMLYNIMQYCEDGDFYGTVMSEINTNDRVDEDRARIWFRQLMLALHHLQQKGVCHRDLSLENIIVHKKSVKIIDFGLALRVPYKSNRPDDNDNMRCVTDVSEGKSRLLMTAQGQGSNWGYMSPEVLAKEKHFDGFAHDLWATGVILYILLVGHKPFHWAHKSDKEFLQIAENRSLKESLVYWGINLSDDAYDLLQNMLQRNPRQRLTLAQVMQHPWVRGSKEKEPEICDSVKENIKAGKSNWFQKKKEKCKGKNRK